MVAETKSRTPLGEELMRLTRLSSLQNEVALDSAVTISDFSRCASSWPITGKRCSPVGRETQCSCGIARTGLEPVLSALRGRRVNQLHQRALAHKDFHLLITRPSHFSQGVRKPTKRVAHHSERTMGEQAAYFWLASKWELGTIPAPSR